MKQIFVVWYELSDPSSNRQRVVQQIKAFGGWARLGDCGYLIKSAQTPVQIRDRISKALSEDDRIFVGLAPAPSAWQGLPEDVSKWIVANQTE